MCQLQNVNLEMHLQKQHDISLKCIHIIMPFGCLVSGQWYSSLIQLFVQHTTWLLTRAQSISLENLNFYYTYCITLKIRTQRQNILNLQLYKKTKQKTNRKHTGYAIDVTYYKMTVLVKGTRFPEGSGLTFFSHLFQSDLTTKMQFAPTV